VPEKLHRKSHSNNSFMNKRREAPPLTFRLPTQEEDAKFMRKLGDFDPLQELDTF